MTRTWDRFVPSTYNPNVPMPVIFALHGSGGTSAKARADMQLEPASSGHAIIIYPQALPSTDPIYMGDNRWDTTAGSYDYAFIDALVHDIETTHCVDRNREFVVGFSLGARFTSMLGCLRAHTFRAIAPVAPGLVPADVPLGNCNGEVGMWEGLGTLDTAHEPAATFVRDYYVRLNGGSGARTAITPSGCFSYDGCHPEGRVVWCTYPLAHEWPSFGGTEIWQFFSTFH